MTAKVFIDGDAGTTGLQIRERLSARADIELLRLADAERKDPARRRDMLNAADVSILCLPDDAAREAAAMTENPAARLIDASTAHRTAAGWTYGFPEYEPGHAAEIARARRVANPGCYALTAIAILHPLVKCGALAADWPVIINGVSGYSGGGKALIAAFEDEGAADYTRAPFRMYALGLAHKHIPEITRWAGLAHAPLFTPAIGRFAQGMIVQVPLPLWAMNGPAQGGADIHAALTAHYANAGAGAKADSGAVEVADLADARAMNTLEPEMMNGTDNMRLYVFANDTAGQCVVTGVLDNLGKGAAGHAVQNLDLMLGAL
ncbi:MAG: N-acetyl-gamma-glutamyl-phosphate reductase [Rhodospirillales bacterium]